MDNRRAFCARGNVNAFKDLTLCPYPVINTEIEGSKIFLIRDFPDTSLNSR